MVAPGALLQAFQGTGATGSFGFSVAFSGNRVLIGAPEDDTDGANSGVARLFDSSTGELLRTFRSPIHSGAELFGVSVAFVGNRVLITAPLSTSAAFWPARLIYLTVTLGLAPHFPESHTGQQ